MIIITIDMIMNIISEASLFTQPSIRGKSCNQRIQLGYESYTDEGDYSYRPDMGLATDISMGENLGLPLTYPTEFTRDTLALNYELQWGANSSFSASLFGNESELWRDERAIQAIWPEDPAIVEGAAENIGLSLLAYSTLGDSIEHQLTYGADIIDYETRYKPTVRCAARKAPPVPPCSWRTALNSAMAWPWFRACATTTGTWMRTWPTTASAD